MKWFGARTLFRLADSGSGRPSAVEQRVVLFAASSHDEALRRAEAEAREYAKTLRWINAQGKPVIGEYLEACEVYEIDGEISNGSEVFSSTSLEERLTSQRDIIERYWGPERDDRVDEALSTFEPDFNRHAGTGLAGK